MKLKTTSQIILVALIPLLMTGCFLIKVVENVEDPSSYFKRTSQQVAKIHRHNPHREGKPVDIHILVYEQSECQLVQITTPVWLVNACLDIGIKAAEREEFEFNQKYDFDWRKIKNLAQIGPGLLVKIEDEESRVLIWLE